ncbi:MAG TPA: hypothetical protein VMT23_02425 [Candidatus Binatia bacterium]|nr:hypothetical protein [Candidatus Binatia bacterium]
MKKWIVLLIVLGFAFVGLAIYYWTTSAGNLPSWLPGYEAGSAHKHLKHGLAALILGLGCFTWAWFLSGKKTATSAPEE